MKKKIFTLLLLTNFIKCLENSSDTIDLTIVGDCQQTGGIPKIALSLFELLKNDLTLSFINSQNNNFDTSCKESLEGKSKKINVSLLTDMLTRGDKKTFNLIPESKIKIAYSMLESTKIPEEWVETLNNKFDAVVVPDNFLINVYKKSGVKIPIFLIPIIIDLKNFLKNKPKKKPNYPFVFGSSIVNYPRKNMELLIKSFSKTFYNNSKVVLKIHTKSNLYSDELKKYIRDAKTNNIELIEKTFTENEYAEFISLLDCYVLISKGEGFSITPREALAAGVPCIISNNTSHTTICKTNYVYSIPSLIKEDAYYPVFKKFCGKHFNCKINDVISAFKTVYLNYNIYLNKAQLGRNWVLQYEAHNLKNKYLNLIKPKKIIFGAKNEITDEYLITSSKSLYNKYLEIIN